MTSLDKLDELFDPNVSLRKWYEAHPEQLVEQGSPEWYFRSAVWEFGRPSIISEWYHYE